MTDRAPPTPSAGHVCIVSGDHLWINPRAVKEADALAAAGYRVTVVGPDLTESDRARDRTILATRPWTRIAAPNLLEAGPLERFLTRLFRRASLFLVQTVGLQTRGALGYGLGSTIRAALAQNADLYCCHVEGGLVACEHLMRQGRRCIMDFEDWHSRDLLPEARRARPVRLIERLEAQILRDAAASFTTSDALADALVAAHGGRRPIVVLNAFERVIPSAPAAPRDRISKKRPSLHWYSQVVGPGRGLEMLFDAVAGLNRDFELHLRGMVSPAYRDALIARLPPALRDRVFFHPTVDPADLTAHIAEHDIGLALEMRSPESRDLTITNKVFQCLQAGLAVVATRTAGQEEAARRYPGAVVLADQTAGDLARALSELIDDPKALARAKVCARAAADGPASWEEASRPLVECARRVLAGQGR